MANKHYGNYGDIWKHLPLAEILHIEKPRQYWESHAGSASYEFMSSAERDFGASRFFANAAQSVILESSQFYLDFRGLFSENPQIYPGSPLIAIEALSKQADRLLFCDIDGESLGSIRRAGSEFGISEDKIDIKRGDGIQIIDDQSQKIKSEKASEIFVFIDPYSIFDKAQNDMNSLHLFFNLTFRGFKTMLWYSYDSVSSQRALHYAVKSARDVLDTVAKLWCGEIQLQPGRENTKIDSSTGITGCGIICGNLSAAAESKSRELGYELECIYQNARLSDGRIVALKFSEIELP
jgi:23S rRNA A2030 N6-methylase RlmJ